MNNKFNNKAFIIARESRGLTQTELAEKSEIQQSNISRYEHGNLSIDDNDLKKISEILKYPIEFFYREMEIYPPNLHYRKKVSASVKLLSKVEAEMNIHRENLQKLLLSIDLETFNLPNSDDVKNLTPTQAAQYLRMYWNIPKGPIDDLTKLLESKGIIIIHSDFGTDKIAGRSMQSKNAIPIVFLNKKDPGDRQRLTLAHELGHVILHLNSFYAFEGDVEKEAWAFASEFLMPQKEIYPYLTGNLKIDKLADLKRYWKISMQSIVYWAKELKAISDNQSRYLWSQFNSLRIRENEPINIPQEKPTLINEIIDLHLTELNYSKKDLAKLLYLFDDEFEDLYFSKSKTLKIIR